VDGTWESALGGIVPVKNGTKAELLLRRSSIADKGFLEAMERKELHKVLDEGTRLLVCLNVRPASPLAEPITAALKSFRACNQWVAAEFLETFNPDTLFFVEVKLDVPDVKQARRLGTERGGLWLITEGFQAVGLASTTIRLPDAVSSQAVSSLNHAYTKLSEIYETQRISHTGNIYRRVLYMETNGKWYPLDLLRNEALHKKEQTIANDLWKQFMARMTSRFKNWT